MELAAPATIDRWLAAAEHLAASIGWELATPFSPGPMPLADVVRLDYVTGAVQRLLSGAELAVAGVAELGRSRTLSASLLDAVRSTRERALPIAGSRYYLEQIARSGVMPASQHPVVRFASGIAALGDAVSRTRAELAQLGA